MQEMINSKQLNLIGVCTIAFGSIIQLTFDVYFILWIGIIIVILSSYLAYTSKNHK